MTKILIRSREGDDVWVEGHTWYVPIRVNVVVSTTTEKFDWAYLPVQLCQCVEKLGEMVIRHSGTKRFAIFGHTIRHLARFIESQGNHLFDISLFTETDWGAFAEWLESQEGKWGGLLTLSTRRGCFNALKLGIKLAIDLEVEGYSEDNLVAIEYVIRRRFRDANLLSSERSAKRSWTEEEHQSLMEILRLEWLAWKDWYRRWVAGNERPPFEQPYLATVVAVYLCFEETVRPEELNVMTIDDINFDDDTLLLHAPNKPEGMINFGAVTRALLQGLVNWAAPARKELRTRRLFVQRLPSPRQLGTRALTRDFRLLLKNYSHLYPINRRIDAKLADGRKTLGSILASRTQDKELVRMTLRHSSYSSMQIYYVRQGKQQLSRNVSQALRPYAVRLSMAYNSPVMSLDEVPPDVAPLLAQYPNHNTNFGPCSDEESLKTSTCTYREKVNCWACPKLIPMASKLDNFIATRKYFLNKAEIAQREGKERMYENRLASAGIVEGHIINIQRKLEEVNGNGKK